MADTKSAFKSKTFWVNLLVALAGVINEILPVVQDKDATRAIIVLSVMNIVLRYLVKQPINPPSLKR